MSHALEFPVPSIAPPKRSPVGHGYKKLPCALTLPPCVQLGAFGAHRPLGLVPLTADCWLEAPWWERGGGGGELAS